MKKLTDDDLMSVARAQSLSKFADPERRGICSNSFLMGAIYVRDEKKKLSDKIILKESEKFANGSYYTKDRIVIGKQSFIDGVRFMLKK